MAADRVGILVPPPAYPLLGLAAAWLLQRIAPLAAVPDGVRWAGAALAALSVMLALWAAGTLLRHRTTIDPYRPTTALVQSGPYRFSRNPIYVAFVLAEAGLGLAFGWWWALGLSPAVALALDVRVVRREEAYLDGKFGQAYQDYRGRVRRWL